MNASMNRQQFLRLLLAAGGASFLGLRGAFAQTQTNTRGPICPWGRLRYVAINLDDDNWSVHPHGDVNLIDHITRHTTVNLDRNWNVARVDQLDQMTRFPFLFMHGELPPALDEKARSNIREYLLRGGFLFTEDCVIGKGRAGRNFRNDKFFQKMAVELPRILPEAKFEKLPLDHPVFHSFFDIRNGLPHMQGTPHGLHGMTYNGRLVALLSPSDTHCGWTNGKGWFSAERAEEAMQMGTNIYLYAMTQAINGA